MAANETSMSDGLGQEFANAIEHASESFDALTMARHEMGAEKYGEVKFLEVDSLEMAMEEVIDLANYARYTFIKLYLLQRAMAKQLDKPAPDMLGRTAFQRGLPPR